MQNAFKRLQKTYGFEIVDANRSANAVNRDLRKKISAILNKD
jgi:thymidylate kinase